MLGQRPSFASECPLRRLSVCARGCVPLVGPRAPPRADGECPLALRRLSVCASGCVPLSGLRAPPASGRWRRSCASVYMMRGCRSAVSSVEACARLRATVAQAHRTALVERSSGTHLWQPAFDPGSCRAGCDLGCYSGARRSTYQIDKTLRDQKSARGVCRV